MLSLKKWLGFIWHNSHLYKDIPVFLLIITPILFCISAISYWYISKIMMKDYGLQLTEAKEHLNHGVVRDLEKLGHYAENISNKVQMIGNDASMQVMTASYNQVNLKQLKNFDICLSSKEQLCSLSKAALHIYRHYISPEVTLNTYIDSLELEQLISNDINNQKIIATLNVTHNASDELSTLLPISQMFSVKLSIKSAVLAADKKSLFSHMIWVSIIVYALVVVMYLIARYLLNLFFYREYRDYINNLRQLILKDRNTIDSLNSKLTCIYKQELATKLEREMLGALFNTVDKIQQISNILLRTNEGRTSLKISEDHKQKFIQIINGYATNLRQRRIFSNQDSLTNTKELVDTAISFFGVNIQDKNLSIINQSRNETIRIKMSQYSLLQVIISILSYQIFVLPRGKEITISSSVRKNNTLAITFKDNGFYLDFEKLRQHLCANTTKVSLLVLDLEVLGSVLREYKGSLHYAEQDIGSQFTVYIPISTSEDKDESNTTNPDITNPDIVNNIYYLHDYKK